MPIISPIGRRSWKLRLVIGSMYALLTLGAISMLYPLLLMISGSMKSETDFSWPTPIPEFLWNDDVLWMKYIESKYTILPQAEAALNRRLESWRSLKPPTSSNPELVQQFIRFRDTVDWPAHWYTLGHSPWERIVGKNTRAFRAEARNRFDGDVIAYSKAAGVSYPSWSHVNPPQVPFAERRFTFPRTAAYQIYYDVKAAAAKADRAVVNLDGEFRSKYLAPVWGTYEEYNAIHGTSYSRYQDVLLPERAPESGQQRIDWEDYVRNHLGLAFVRIDESATERFRVFLRLRFGNIDQLNAAWDARYPNFGAIALPTGVPPSSGAQTSLGQFIKDPDACPMEAVSVYGPRQAFEQFLSGRQNLTAEPIKPGPLPIEEMDYHDFLNQKTSLRWEFVKRNYLTVLDYLWQHGNGIRNTIIFCALLVATNLIVNPLAAYALSRYRPPTTYTVLLFCMATMAFPVEVTMIPSFLLLKRFPLLGIFVGVASAIGIAFIIHKLKPTWPNWGKGVLAGAVGILIGYWGASWIWAHVLGRGDSTVSLLNTFWALVLPGMANGFSIFLLKGFFDSLPRELYESAEIDGAGEWTKFWMITMSLSKPILAVLALGAFTAAYTEFMMALVLIPDPEMWTMMVWLFQLQTWSHPSVVYASLVVAAIPTMVVFLAAQRVLLRGIVVPTEK